MLQAYRVPINQATDTSSGGHGAVGYGKGSQVLAMLEDLLGTDVMIKCMRRFLRDHVRGEPADWPDFQKAVRSETGKDYGWFFEQWLTRSGVPIVRLAGVNLSVKSGAPMVRGRIVQEGLPYRLRIPVSLEGREGPITREIEVSETETEFSLPAPSGLMTVALDPAGNILMAGASTDERTDPFRQAVSPP